MLMIQSEPKKRPKVEQLMHHDFIAMGYCPKSLPSSCLTMAPRFEKVTDMSRKPLTELNYGIVFL